MSETEVKNFSVQEKRIASGKAVRAIAGLSIALTILGVKLWELAGLIYDNKPIEICENDGRQATKSGGNITPQTIRLWEQTDNENEGYLTYKGKGIISPADVDRVGREFCDDGKSPYPGVWQETRHDFLFIKNYEAQLKDRSVLSVSSFQLYDGYAIKITGLSSAENLLNEDHFPNINRSFEDAVDAMRHVQILYDEKHRAKPEGNPTAPAP